MLSGISVFCFAASYTVALALEATRLWFRSGVRGALMLGFAGAGLVAHTLFLIYRAISADAAPLSSAFDWYLLAAWVVVVVYLYSIYYHPTAAIGIFVLPVVLAHVSEWRNFSAREPFPQDPAAQVLGDRSRRLFAVRVCRRDRRIRRRSDVPAASAPAQSASSSRPSACDCPAWSGWIA